MSLPAVHGDERYGPEHSVAPVGGRNGREGEREGGGERGRGGEREGGRERRE